MKKFSSKMKGSSQRTSSKKRLVTIALTTAVLLGVLLLLPWFAHKIAAIVVTPVVKTVHWFETSSASLPQYLRNRSDLLSEITDLQNELATMRADRYATERLERENSELRSLLNDAGDTRVVAGVIGRPPALPYDVLLLDRGSDAGLVAGAPVFIGQQTVIGVVRSVTDQTAVVDLVTSPAFTSLVYIMGADVYATARGIGGGQLVVGVPQGVAVNIEDVVILPSISPGVYGLVTHVATVPTQAQQNVFVSPEIPINSLRLVTVATQPIAEPDLDSIEATTASARAAFAPVSTAVLEQATTSATSTASQTSVSTSTNANTQESL